MTLMKRSIMTLYSDDDIYSHQVRIVTAAKGVSVEVVHVDENHPSEDLAELNPYNSLPTLLDRELVLYQPNVIMEYLDERFPHPPLLPVYPVARAKSRLLMHRIHRDWYSLLEAINGDDYLAREQSKQDLRDGLVALDPVFANMPYFLSDDFTLVDCCIGPLLWRLPSYGINLPESAKGIAEYCKRVFDLEFFQASLTETEREMRELLYDF